MNTVGAGHDPKGAGDGRAAISERRTTVSRRTLQAGRWEDVERAQRILEIAAMPTEHDGHPTFSHVGHALVCLAESLGVIEPWTNVIEKGPVPVDGAAWEASVYRRQLDGGFVLLSGATSATSPSGTTPGRGC